MSTEPDKITAVRTLPTEPVKIDDWKLSIELGSPQQIIEIDVVDWETSNDPSPKMGPDGEPNWNEYWRKRQQWVKDTFGVELTMSQTYQIFSYVRRYWNTIRPFFDAGLESAFGITPTPGNSPSGKSD